MRRLTPQKRSRLHDGCVAASRAAVVTQNVSFCCFRAGRDAVLPGGGP